MHSKAIFALLAAAILTGCASMKGPRETAVTYADGSPKEASAIQQYENERRRRPSDNDKTSVRYNLPLVYITAFQSASNPARVKPEALSSVASFAGNVSMATAAFGSLGNHLGATHISSSFLGSLFVTGLLAGTNDRITTHGIKLTHQRLVEGKALFILTTTNTATLPATPQFHDALEREFTTAANLAASLGCSPTTKSNLVIEGLLHRRSYDCQRIPGAVTAETKAFSLDGGQSGFTSGLVLLDLNAAASAYEEIKHLIPPTHYAVFGATTNNGPAIVVAKGDTVAAFAPPPAP